MSDEECFKKRVDKKIDVWFKKYSNTTILMWLDADNMIGVPEYQEGLLIEPQIDRAVKVKKFCIGWKYLKPYWDLTGAVVAGTMINSGLVPVLITASATIFIPLICCAIYMWHVDRVVAKEVRMIELMVESNILTNKKQ